MTTDDAHTKGMALSRRRPTRRVTTQVIPIVLAVAVTGVCGYWFKNQDGFEENWRRNGPRGLRFPAVTASLANYGSGSPSNRAWKNATEAGSWAWFDLKDDGIPRAYPSRRLLAVTAVVRDGQGQQWPSETQPYRNGVLVFVPTGYTSTPDKLSVTLTAGAKKLGSWPMPALSDPEQRLTAIPSQASNVTVRLSEDERKDVIHEPNLHVTLDKPVAKGETVKIALAAHTFHRFAEVEWFEIHPGGTAVSLPSHIFGDAGPVKEVEILIERQRYYEIRKRVSLEQSYLKEEQHQAFLDPKPAKVELAPGVTFDVSSSQKMIEEIGRPSTIDLILTSETPYRDFQATILQPATRFNGINLHLLNKITRKHQGLIFGKHQEPLVDRPGFTPGPFPIVLDIAAWPYEVVEKKRLVLALPELKSRS